MCDHMSMTYNNLQMTKISLITPVNVSVDFILRFFDRSHLEMHINEYEEDVGRLYAYLY